MNEPEKSQKTEQPSKKRLKKAREKGQISQSKDLVIILMMTATFVYFYVRWDGIWHAFQTIVVTSTQLMEVPFEDGLLTLADTLEEQFAYIVYPLLAIIILVGVIGHVIQFGFVLSFDTIVPKMSKVDPASGFKKIFSTKNVLEFLKSLLKVCVIAFAGTIVFMNAAQSLLKVPQCSLDCAIYMLNESTSRTVRIAVPIIFAIALLDIVLQKKLFIKQQRMTKEEVKRERKDDLGDPRVVGQRKSMHKEIVSEGIQNAVENAVVVLFDYGDRSIVLHYNAEEMPLPLIAMMTRGAMTEKIRDIARESKRPILRDGPLVASLNLYGRPGQYIPSECVEGVANVLRNIRQ